MWIDLVQQLWTPEQLHRVIDVSMEVRMALRHFGRGHTSKDCKEQAFHELRHLFCQRSHSHAGSKEPATVAVWKGN
jgi:hypothetical protein